MAELSKTARASMGRSMKEVHVETTEEAIKAIRDNRAGNLFIGDMSRVDKLLEAFDKVVFANGELTNALNQETSKVLTLESEIRAASALLVPVINNAAVQFTGQEAIVDAEPVITQEHEDLEHGGEG